MKASSCAKSNNHNYKHKPIINHNNMKKFLILFALAVVSIVAKAEINEGSRMGLRGTFGQTNVIYEGDKASIGYGADWIIEQNFSPNFYLQSGLGIQSINHTEESIMGTLSGTYAQLPIHLGGRAYLNESTSLNFQAGPTLAYGLFGSDLTFSGGGSSSYFDLFKRFDFAIGGRVGVQFMDKFEVSLGLNYGLVQIHDDIDAHNYCLNLGFGYMF